MYTAQQIFDLTMDLVNKRLANGTVNANTTAVYKARTPGILTMWQNENAKIGDLYKTVDISNKPTENLLGLNSGFDYLEFIGDEIIKETDGSVKAYYFEVDGDCTVYIEDYNGTWNTLATITPTGVTDFTPYKGVVTPSTGATQSRIRFTGVYRYLITNYALFSVPMAPTKVIDYRPWIKKQMPDDFKSLNQIIEEYPVKQYSNSSDYKWEGRRDLYINYNYEGNIRIIYKPIPSPITSLTDTIAVDDITAMSGAYFLAAHILLVEDPDSASFFNQRYEDLKIQNNTKQPVAIQNITDVYGGGWQFG